MGSEADISAAGTRGVPKAKSSGFPKAERPRGSRIPMRVPVFLGFPKRREACDGKKHGFPIGKRPEAERPVCGFPCGFPIGQRPRGIGMGSRVGSSQYIGMLILDFLPGFPENERKKSRPRPVGVSGLGRFMSREFGGTLGLTT